jgi:hypothetical protein
MTPMVLPSSLLLRRPARIPTRKITESRVFPLDTIREMGMAVVWIDKANNSQCPEACSPILEVKVGRFRMGIRIVFDGVQRELGHGDVGERSFTQLLD